MGLINWWKEVSDEELDKIIQPLVTGGLIIAVLGMVYLIFRQIKELI